MTNSPALEQGTIPTSGAGDSIRLNLGGLGEGFLDGRIEGFQTVDLREGADIQSDVSDLKMFSNQSIDELYSSNVLEHFPHSRTVDVLKEWHRVLKRKQSLWVSVPDFEVAVQLYRKEGLSEWLKYHLWGDQKHPLNYHYTCFTFASLAKNLLDAGFSDIKRVRQWPFKVADGSQNVDSHYGMLISLNVEATA